MFTTKRTNLLVLVLMMLGAVSSAAQTANDLLLDGNFEQAKKAYEKAKGSVQDRLLPQLRLGQIALLDGKYPQAERHFRWILKNDPENVEAKRQLAEALVREHKFNEAANLYRDVGEEAKADQLGFLGQVHAYAIAASFQAAHIPFVQTNPLPLVEARINDSQPAYFLIDTGGADIVIDDIVAKAAGVRTFGSSMGTFAGGKPASVMRGELKSFTLGNLTVNNIPISIQDTRRYAAVAQGRPVAGVIGTVFLSQFLCTLDYGKGDLLLLPRNSKVRTRKTDVSLPFWMVRDHLIMAKGAINDSAPMLMLVDTGLAGMGLTAPTRVLKAVGVELSSETVEGMGGGGLVKAQPFKADSVTLGPVRRTEILGVAGVFPSAIENVDGIRLDALISHQFFAHSSLTFDFLRMRLHFDPEP